MSSCPGLTPPPCDGASLTIEALIERDRETNILVRGLQEMLTPLVSGGRRREEPPAYTQ